MITLNSNIFISMLFQKKKYIAVRNQKGLVITSSDILGETYWSYLISFHVSVPLYTEFLILSP